MTDATCRRRDASGYRDTRWIIYYDSPLQLGCPRTLHSSAYSSFSSSSPLTRNGGGAWIRRPWQCLLLPAACNCCFYLLASRWHLAVTALMHLGENGRAKRRDDAALTDRTCKYEVFHHKTLRIARNAAWPSRAESSLKKKSINNVNAQRTAFHQRPNLFITRAYNTATLIVDVRAYVWI